MPELGQNCSPRGFAAPRAARPPLPRGWLTPLHGPGPAWVVGAQWEPVRRLLCVQWLASSTPRGDTALGRFGLGHIITDGTS